MSTSAWFMWFFCVAFRRPRRRGGSSIQTLFMFTGRISSCVMDECVTSTVQPGIVLQARKTMRMKTMRRWWGCRWQTRLAVTQLDGDAGCGSIGYAASLLQFVVYIFRWRRLFFFFLQKTSGCSTSSWLSAKIRSRATPPPPPPPFILLLLLLPSARSSPGFYLFIFTSFPLLIAFPPCLSVSSLLVLISVIRLPGISRD